MTSSEGFQQHFSIISKKKLLWFLHEKESSFYTHLFYCTEMRRLHISVPLPFELLVQIPVLELDQNVHELEFEQSRM